LEKNVACPELCKDTAKTPYVHSIVVFTAQNHLRGSIRSRLHIRTQMVVDEAAAAQVNDLHFAARVTLDKNVFRLQVAVDEAETV
jgi:hypothetical protein